MLPTVYAYVSTMFMYVQCEIVLTVIYHLIMYVANKLLLYFIATGDHNSKDKSIFITYTILLDILYIL